MIDAAEHAGRILTVGHIERFNPAIRELQAAARRPASWAGSSRSRPRGSARSRPAFATSGVVVDLAPHDLDIMRYLLG